MDRSFGRRFQEWLNEWNELKTRQVLVVVLAVLMGLLAAGAYRGGREVALFWERVRLEIERRRVQGARARGPDGEDDGGTTLKGSWHPDERGFDIGLDLKP